MWTLLKQTLLLLYPSLVAIGINGETPVNLAAGRPTYQSSDYNSTQWDGVYAYGLLYSNFAVDGNYTAWGWRCAHTNAEAGAWWVVDIGGPHRVEKVAITNREDETCPADSQCASRLSDFYIRVGNSFNESTFDPTTYAECWYEAGTFEAGETREFTCNDVIVGRYVTIHFPTTKTEFLQLCEVEVFSDNAVDAFFQQEVRTTEFLPCLSECLLDETCTAVNLDGESCILLSPDQYPSNSEVDFHMLPEN